MRMLATVLLLAGMASSASAAEMCFQTDGLPNSRHMRIDSSLVWVENLGTYMIQVVGISPLTYRGFGAEGDEIEYSFVDHRKTQVNGTLSFRADYDDGTIRYNSFKFQGSVAECNQ